MNPIKRVLSYPAAVSEKKRAEAEMAALHEEALSADRYRDLARTRSYTSVDYAADKRSAESRDRVGQRLQRETDLHLNGWNKKDPLPLGDDVLAEIQRLHQMGASVTSAAPVLFWPADATR